MKIGVVTGSFDPITLGHLDIIRRSSTLYDKVVVAMFINPDKEYYFDKDNRLKMIKASVQNWSNVEVAYSEGYAVDFCNSIGAKSMIRGVRNNVDYAYEVDLARENKKLGGITTIMLLASSDIAEISSSKIRERLDKGLNIDKYIPSQVIGLAIRRKNE